MASFLPPAFEPGTSVNESAVDASSLDVFDAGSLDSSSFVNVGAGDDDDVVDDDDDDELRRCWNAENESRIVHPFVISTERHLVTGTPIRGPTEAVVLYPTPAPTPLDRSILDVGMGLAMLAVRMLKLPSPGRWRRLQHATRSPEPAWRRLAKALAPAAFSDGMLTFILQYRCDGDVRVLYVWYVYVWMKWEVGSGK